MALSIWILDIPCWILDIVTNCASGSASNLSAVSNSQLPAVSKRRVLSELIDARRADDRVIGVAQVYRDRLADEEG